MNYHIDIQDNSQFPIPIEEYNLIEWAELTLADSIIKAELTIRLVESKEIQSLNKQYRNKDKPTNVLAFPAGLPEEIELEIPLLGDVIICPEVLKKESESLEVPPDSHWAHIVIHGVLHLLGYDHIKESDAEVMQSIEIKLLSKLGYSNPYIKEDNQDG